MLDLLKLFEVVDMKYVDIYSWLYRYDIAVNLSRCLQLLEKFHVWSQELHEEETKLV